jgi:hypothetical protein
VKKKSKSPRKVREKPPPPTSCVIRGCDQVAKPRTIVDKKPRAKWTVLVCDFHFEVFQSRERVLLAHQKGTRS